MQARILCARKMLGGICTAWVALLLVCFVDSNPVFAQSGRIQVPGKQGAGSGNQADQNGSNQDGEAKPQALLPTFDGNAAFEYLKQVVAIGPRISGTEGMAKQQAFIKEHFEALGATVQRQPFNARHPHLGTIVELSNQIVQFHPERTSRLMFCCHYDTRPFSDQDPRNPQGIFLGANDGASGVGLLCEFGKHIPEMEGKFGIDFVFFDAEEFVYVHRRDPMFLGSTFFANEYAAKRVNANYTYAILVDMVADADLQIHYEHNSMVYAPRLTRSIWGVAQRLNVTEFIPKKEHKIRDDHIPLNTIAKIRTCDVIDFDFPNPQAKNAYWHTQQDIVENCSADSLTKVGWVLLEWTKQMQQLNTK